MGTEDVLNRGTVLLVLLNREADENRRLGERLFERHHAFRPTVIVTDFLSPAGAKELLVGTGFGSMTPMIQQVDELRPFVETEVGQIQYRVAELKQMLGRMLTMSDDKGTVVVATNNGYAANLIMEICGSPLIFEHEGAMFRIVCNGESYAVTPVVLD